ncbi:MAG: hypothetical protein AB8G77_16125 [Rhodothermales bacterium]
MSFNVSRFLVRVRQFWTRERLVPVLGVSAIVLFGLTSYQYFSSLFAEKPIVATHLIINGQAFQSSDAEGVEADFFSWEYDHSDRHSRWHHKKWNHERLRKHVDWDNALDQKRRALELRREILEHERFEFKNRVLKFKTGDDDDDDKVIIMRGDGEGEDVVFMHEDGEESIEITINGKKIEAKKHKEI